MTLTLYNIHSINAKCMDLYQYFIILNKRPRYDQPLFLFTKLFILLFLAHLFRQYTNYLSVRIINKKHEMHFKSPHTSTYPDHQNLSKGQLAFFLARTFFFFSTKRKQTSHKICSNRALRICISILIRKTINDNKKKTEHI